MLAEETKMELYGYWRKLSTHFGKKKIEEKMLNSIESAKISGERGIDFFQNTGHFFQEAAIWTIAKSCFQYSFMIWFLYIYFPSRKAVNIAQSHGFDSKEIGALVNLANFYEVTGDFKQVNPPLSSLLLHFCRRLLSSLRQ